MARIGMTSVFMEELPRGYAFTRCGERYQVWFGDGAWTLRRLLEQGFEDLEFESLNEAMNHVLDGE